MTDEKTWAKRVAAWRASGESATARASDIARDIIEKQPFRVEGAMNIALLFMVKAIADEAKYETPSFFGYAAQATGLLSPIYLALVAYFVWAG